MLAVGSPWVNARVPQSRSITPLLNGTGERKYVTKVLGVEIRTGRDHLPITITGKADSIW